MQTLDMEIWKEMYYKTYEIARDNDVAFRRDRDLCIHHITVSKYLTKCGIPRCYMNPYKEKEREKEARKKSFKEIIVEEIMI